MGKSPRNVANATVRKYCPIASDWVRENFDDVILEVDIEQPKSSVNEDIYNYLMMSTDILEQAIDYYYGWDVTKLVHNDVNQMYVTGICNKIVLYVQRALEYWVKEGI